MDADAPRGNPNRGVIQHYEELDPFYRDIWGKHLHHGLWRSPEESVSRAVRRMVRRVGERVGIQEGDRVCDVGSGYGAPARYLARRFGCEVVGITLSERQLQRSGRDSNDGGNPRFLRGDWLRNPFPAGCFDRLISIECVSHVADREKFFGEARRVLVPGGRLVVCAWLRSDGVSDRQRRWLLEPIRREGRLASLSTGAEYRRWIENSGLVLESCEELGERVRRTWWVVMKRFVGRLLTDPRYRRFLVDSSRENRDFALAVPKLWWAYRRGAMEYGMFKARRPGG